MKFLSLNDSVALKLAAATNDSFKDAFIDTKHSILRSIDICKDDFVLKVLDEEVITIYGGLSFHPFHFLYKPFNDQLLRLFQSGFIDYWRIKKQGSFQNWKPKKSGPIVLTWNHVYVGFYICLVCHAVAIACFIAENFYFRLMLLIRELSHIT